MQPQALPLHTQPVHIRVVPDPLQRLLGSRRKGLGWEVRAAAFQVIQQCTGLETDAQAMDADLGADHAAWLQRSVHCLKEGLQASRPTVRRSREARLSGLLSPAIYGHGLHTG